MNILNKIKNGLFNKHANNPSKYLIKQYYESGYIETLEKYHKTTKFTKQYIIYYTEYSYVNLLFKSLLNNDYEIFDWSITTFSFTNEDLEEICNYYNIDFLNYDTQKKLFNDIKNKAKHVKTLSAINELTNLIEYHKIENTTNHCIVGIVIFQDGL